MWKRTLPLLCLVTGPLFAQDPFQPGMRWIRGASPLVPWVPQDVGFSGQDALVWGAAGGGQPHLFLLDAHGVGAPPARRELALDPGLILTHTAGGSSGQLFALRHGSGSGGTWTEVQGFDPLAPGGSAGFGAAWTHAALAGGAAPLLAADAGGFLLAAAQHLPAQGAVVVDLLAGATGALHMRTFLPAAALNALAVSADGRRIALAAGFDRYVIDRDGQVLLHVAAGGVTKALALAPGGEQLAVGVGGVIELYGEAAGSWSQMGELPAHPDPAQAAEWTPVHAALGADGGTAAVAWWRSGTGREAAFEIWQGSLRRRRVELADAGQGLQNLPVGVAMTRDGTRAAFAAWGNGVDAELWLLDRDDATLDQAWDLPGSPRDVALDDTGTRVVVAHGDAHANVFTSTGAVRLYDTGERDLQQLKAAVAGSTGDFAARHPGASLVLFLVGDAVAPSPVLGVPGLLHLERSSLSVAVAAADGAGRADWSLLLPPSASAFLGASFSVQAAFRTPGGTVLGAALARGFVLE